MADQDGAKHKRRLSVRTRRDRLLFLFSLGGHGVRWRPRSPGRRGDDDRRVDRIRRNLSTSNLTDYRARTPGTFFAEEDRPHLTLDEAYAVHAEVAALRGADGEPVASYKVGCTGPNVREQSGMDGPIRGLLYDTELHPSEVELSHASYANFAIEGELAIWLGDDAEIERVFPVIELHNYVFRSKTPDLQELVANNCYAGR